MRFYYGWVVVALSGVIMLLIMGTTVAVYGLYVLPVAEDFNLSRADVNTAFVVANLGGAVLAPVIGRMADIFPVRRIMVAGTFCYGLGFVALGLSDNVWLSMAVLALATPMMIAGMASIGAMTLVARWFEAQRARAMALAVIGMSLGSVVMAPTVAWLIETVGWREALVLQGTVIGACFLVLIFFLRERPGPNDVEPVPRNARAGAGAGTASARQVEKPLNTRQILRIPRFRILAAAMALGMGTFQAIFLSLVPMVQEAGIGIAAAAGLVSITGTAGIVGKFVLAWLGDAFDKSLTLAIMLALLAMVVAALPFPEGYAAFALLAGLVGLVGGAMMPLFMASLADFVGSASFASANGMASLLVALGGAAAMRGSGEIYDYTGGYQALFLVLAALIGLAAVLMLFCSRMSQSIAEPAPA